MSPYEEQARQARDAAALLRRASAGQKTAVIRAMAARIRSHGADILKANKADVAEAKQAGLGEAKLDRLKLDEKRLAEVIGGLEVVAAVPDPVGKIVDDRRMPAGFRVLRVRMPIGVILMIFESRPSVTAEAAALCVRSSNAVLLKGGSEALLTNRMFGACLQGALSQEGLPSMAVQTVEGGHEAVEELLKLDQYVNLVIPRGGEGLIRAVAEKTRIPVIKHYKGNCHVYVDADANQAMAVSVVHNAKVQRPATCNAAEKLLIHESVAAELLPMIARKLREGRVELRGDEKARKIVPGMKPAKDEDWTEEYLDLIMTVKVVKDLDEAIRHINTYGSGHTDSIITQSEPAARKFIAEVDSASVMWNASTRLADGGVYGLGAEIGISTERLHARGPMGAEELTCPRWVVLGDGHLRQ